MTTDFGAGTIHAMYSQQHNARNGGYVRTDLALCLHVKRSEFGEVYTIEQDKIDTTKILTSPGVNCRACLEVIHA